MYREIFKIYLQIFSDYRYPLCHVTIVKGQICAILNECTCTVKLTSAHSIAYSMFVPLNFYVFIVQLSFRKINIVKVCTCYILSPVLVIFLQCKFFKSFDIVTLELLRTYWGKYWNNVILLCSVSLMNLSLLNLCFLIICFSKIENWHIRICMGEDLCKNECGLKTKFYMTTRYLDKNKTI
jgi:hypothetical protein